MWKDFFYFSKSQRIGILVMILLIVIVIVANYSLSIFIVPKANKSSNFLAEVKEFEMSLLLRDSLQKAKWQQAYEDRQNDYNNKYNDKYNDKYQYSTPYADKSPRVLFSFDPNTIDSAGLVRLGVKPSVSSTILKYRKKGGVFKTALDFSKVYGVSDKLYKELSAYISIPTKTEFRKDSVANTSKFQNNSPIVELNSADTSMLMRVKGIGRGYAIGIVKFRTQAGGFVSVEQLKEIYGMRDQNFEKIKQFCTVNRELIRRIKVNTASVERLNFHPYLNFYQAKAIYELRRRKGRLKALKDIEEIAELNPDDIERIKPYLNFE